MKAFEQHFSVVLFVKLYNVFFIVKSVDNILSNQNCSSSTFTATGKRVVLCFTPILGVGRRGLSLTRECFIKDHLSIQSHGESQCL